MACHDSIPRGKIDVMAEEWGAGVDFSALDPRTVEIEAAWLAKQYKRSHVKELGNLTPKQPDSVSRWMYLEVNNASSDDIRLQKSGEIKQLVGEHEVQGLGLVELVFNWSLAPPSAHLTSWFKDWKECTLAISHNTHGTIQGMKHQQGGCGLMAFGTLRQYVQKRCVDFCHLGQWCSWLVYDNLNHIIRFISAYNTGRPKPEHYGTIYQQHL